ncbi:hypothetical protein MBLNU13_g08542t2 [Cladosporium sp. NU13]
MPTNPPDTRAAMNGHADQPAERPPAPPSLGSEMSSASSTATVQRRSTSATRQNSVSSSHSTHKPTLRKQQSASLLPSSSSPSATSSPKSSRNTSPIRKEGRSGAPASQTFSSQPSAAAIQRALSASNVPQLSSGGSVTEAVSKLPARAGPKSAGPASGESTPQWPASPRLKSPPPSSRVLSGRQAGITSVAGKKAEEAGPANTSSPSTTAVPPAPPSISIQGATPTNNAILPSNPSGNGKQSASDASKSDQSSSLQASTKMPSRGPSGKSTLETVQENSADAVTEPSPAAVQAAADLKPALRSIYDDTSSTPKKDHEDNEKHTRTGESESEGGGNRSEGTNSPRISTMTPGNQQPKSKTSTPKNSFPALTTTKSRQPEGTRNMTVETETVQSIPQSSLNAGDRLNGGRGEHSGSVRLKPSNETIRPKKERKKPSTKARSVNQGTGTFRSPLLLPRDSIDDLHGATCVSSTASMSEDEGSGPTGPRRERILSRQFRNVLTSTFRKKPSMFFGGGGSTRSASNRNTSEASSKADIFEARVANAVEDANSSDSDETFVYESNPPEQQRRPRHHSRTPSVNSSHSIAESRSGIRNYNDAMEERRVNGKRSMKFSNNPFNELDSPNERQDGTASKLRNSATNLRHSRPNSPRSPQSMQHNRASGPALFSGRRKDNSFDFDGEGADDERTPLMGTVRTPRSSRHGHSHLHSSAGNSMDDYYSNRQRSRCGRLGGCMFGFAVFVAVVLSAVAFLVMSNRPMYDLKIEKVQNVLASEQEIMLDLLVGAVNPNALGISVSDMDVNIFAKSKHVGRSGDFSDNKPTEMTSSISLPPIRRKRFQPPSPASKLHYWYPHKDPPSPSPTNGHNHGTDPDDSLEGDSQTMLLGRIFHFDQSLTFEGSPIKRHPHFSVGELRLAHPGNKTEAGGSHRWEEVLKHPFELIIRGVLRYQLPVSNRVLNAAVAASVLVHPEDGVDDEGNMRLEQPDRPDDWEWVDWDEIMAGVGPGGERTIAEGVE